MIITTIIIFIGAIVLLVIIPETTLQVNLTCYVVASFLWVPKKKFGLVLTKCDIADYTDGIPQLLQIYILQFECYTFF